MIELHTKDGNRVLVFKDQIHWVTDDPAILQSYNATTGCVIMLGCGALVVQEAYEDVWSAICRSNVI